MLHIRKVALHELAALADLERRSAEYEHRIHPLDCSIESLVGIWKHRMATGAYEVLTAVLQETEDDPSRMVGFIGFTAPEGGNAFVQAMYVDPEFFRRGIGIRLFAAAEHFCRNRGCRSVVLHVEPGNKAGMRFYSKVGFIRQPYKKRHLFVLTKEL